MCIICVSPKGINPPSETLIETMYSRNPHGAGYMVARNSRVEIHKGFMSLTDFKAAVRRENFTADDVIVYHFRIATQAGVNPTMTHPFPLTKTIEYMTKLDLKCPIGVAHNGIIPMTSNGDKTYSDTALYIANYLTRLIRNTKDL